MKVAALIFNFTLLKITKMVVSNEAKEPSKMSLKQTQQNSNMFLLFTKRSANFIHSILQWIHSFDSLKIAYIEIKRFTEKE